MEALALIAISFFSSMLTAILGLGGGILLISVMPGLLPAAAVVPVHGIVQLASNVSRALFGLPHVRWPIVRAFAAGAVLGAAAGSTIVLDVPTTWLPLLLGAFVLVVTWTPKSAFDLRWPGRFFTLGAVQTFVSLFVGAAGPLTSPLLLREELSRDRLVVTHGALMSVLHALKTATFVFLGFELAPYLPLLAGMIVSVTLGSWAGTRLRARLDPERFRKAFKIVLTLLALRLMLGVAV